MKTQITLLTFLFLFTHSAFAQKVGGTLQLRLDVDPVSFNPITGTDVPGRDVYSYVVESLMQNDPDTNELKPNLAEKVESSKDGMEHIFTLREGLKWQDGTPITTEDVKFSFDVIWDDKFPNVAPQRPYFEAAGHPEILDARRIKFKFVKKYYQTLDYVGGHSIVPKHLYNDPKAMNKKVVGSGAYKFESYDRGSKVTLVRDPSWWGFKVESEKHKHNFEKIIFRITSNQDVALEMFKKGQIDFMGVSAEVFNKKAVGPDWGKKYIKIKTENKAPKGYGFIGWNLKRPLFQDKNVRVALAMLFNRPMMNEKFRYGMSHLVSSPVYPTGDTQPPGVKPLPFDPTGAAELLKKAGWQDADKNGVLEKTVDGKKTEFKFTILNPGEDFMKYLTVYKEDAKKAGVDIEIKQIEWNSFIKLIDEGNFDGVTLSWGGGSPEDDLKQIWHSSAAVKGGSNFVGYKNPEVDKYIEQAREEMNKKKRVPLWQKAAEIIANDAPYLFLFSPKNVLYVVNSKVHRPKDSYTYGIGTEFWWME